MKIRHICFSVIFVLIVYVISFAGKCAYSQLPVFGTPTERKLMIFLSNTATPGSFGGANGADNICNLDPAKPNGSFYRALIMDGTRNSTEHPSWALRPNTKYWHTDGVNVIGSTEISSAKLQIPLTYPITSANESVWTGITAGWTLSASCINWSTTSGNSYVGKSNEVSMALLYNAVLLCSMSARLYCVEQP